MGSGLSSAAHYSGAAYGIDWWVILLVLVYYLGSIAATYDKERACKSHKPKGG